MNRPNPSSDFSRRGLSRGWIRVLLSSLLLSSEISGAREGLWIYTGVLVAYGLLLFLWKVVKHFFPRPLALLGLVSTLSVAAHGAYFWSGVDPAWVLSVLILMDVFKPESLEVSEAPALRYELLLGCGFWVTGLYLSLAQQLFSGLVFVTASVSLFLLAIAAFFWRNQPERAGKGASS